MDVYYPNTVITLLLTSVASSGPGGRVVVVGEPAAISPVLCEVKEGVRKERSQRTNEAACRHSPLADALLPVVAHSPRAAVVVSSSLLPSEVLVRVTSEAHLPSVGVDGSSLVRVPSWLLRVREAAAHPALADSLLPVVADAAGTGGETTLASAHGPGLGAVAGHVPGLAA